MATGEVRVTHEYTVTSNCFRHLYFRFSHRNVGATAPSPRRTGRSTNEGYESRTDARRIPAARYSHSPTNVVSRLTERQREVLEAAVDLGYYQEPREAIHDEIATATGIAETTVGEHLRKIEAAVFSSLHVGATHRLRD